MIALLKFIAGFIVVVGGLGTVFFVGMRAKWAPLQDLVKGVNKKIFNPMQMKSAGTPGSYAGIIRHVGRSSGTDYETPIGVLEAGDDFLIMLPYGTSPDWLKNIRAAGTAELVHEGDTYAVEEPRIINLDTAKQHLSEKDRKTADLFNMEDFLLLHGAGQVVD